MLPQALCGAWPELAFSPAIYTRQAVVSSGALTLNSSQGHRQAEHGPWAHGRAAASRTPPHVVSDSRPGLFHYPASVCVWRSWRSGGGSHSPLLLSQTVLLSVEAPAVLPDLLGSGAPGFCLWAGQAVNGVMAEPMEQAKGWQDD